jgi:hypothetical protein
MTDSALSARPRAADAARTRIDVTDFRADRTGSSDSGLAVRAALAHAAAVGGPVTLVFPRGTYAFWSRSATLRELYASNTVGADERYREKRIGILLEGFDDIEIDGGGSRFEYHGRQTTLAVIGGGRAVLHDFAIDMVQPTVVEVTVARAGVDGGRAFRLLTMPHDTVWSIEGMGRAARVVWHGESDPVSGFEDWRGVGALEYSQVHDPRSERTWRQDCPLFDGVESLSRTPEGILVRYASTVSFSDVGLVYQLRDTVRDHPGILALESDSVTFRDVAVHYLHGFGLLAQNGVDLALERVDFRTPPGSTRRTAGFADFVQASGMRGAIDIRDCVFDGAHDDAINVHGTYLRIDGVTADSITATYAHDETAGFPQFAAGDLAEVIDRATGSVVATDLVVASVVGPSGRDHRVALDTMTVRFADPLPSVVSLAPAGSLAVENITRTPSLHVSDSTFVNLPTRGILVSTRKPIRIERNRFERLPMAGVFLSSDAAEWWESGPVRDCVIADNTFVELGGPAVLVAPGQAPGAEAGVSVHRGIQVAGNVLVVGVGAGAGAGAGAGVGVGVGVGAGVGVGVGAGAGAVGRVVVDATSVSELVITGNRVVEVGAGPAASSVAAAVRLDRCPGAVVDNG